ncbi:MULTISPECIES: hypothetical protein [Enterobacter]|uniref:hypothetical protein n=1 Tax=Enterobacter TaxID=547 RepID=UPI000481FEFE|nr:MULTISPECIES: hypothetical protein [Enterobacter cloacae complex]HDT2077483.1 hypothetical protein [Enterobacter roggenkampii]HEG2000063.1 hypothetical protein [Enterobacter asburiae]MCD2460956.1 hypothetical protein [Enterobacter cloacae complex sp. 2021EL-01261]MDT9873531.1 hypothetical protein [Enterobacter cloacae]HDT2097898.1 hypothetical protein [Enterobacter roggenkampii]
MNIHKSYSIAIASIFLSVAVHARNVIIANEVKNNDGSVWVVEKNNDGYNVKYTNAQGKEYDNNTIITSDIEGSNLFLDALSTDAVSLLMDYPKDAYIFKFSSGEIPRLLSACKRITLPSAEQQQVVAVLTLCSKQSVTEKVTLSNADADKLLASDNLTLDGSVKTLIGNDKAFLYDENKKQKRNKPYLIKGDVVEILDYESSMLKIKYKSKAKIITAWINFVDIL